MNAPSPQGHSRTLGVMGRGHQSWTQMDHPEPRRPVTEQTYLPAAETSRRVTTQRGTCLWLFVLEPDSLFLCKHKVFLHGFNVF